MDRVEYPCGTARAESVPCSSSEPPALTVLVAPATHVSSSRSAAAPVTATRRGGDASMWCCGRSTGRTDEKAFVDYAGPTFSIVERSTGKCATRWSSSVSWGNRTYAFVDLTRRRGLPGWMMTERPGGRPRSLRPMTAEYLPHMTGPFRRCPTRPALFQHPTLPSSPIAPEGRRALRRTVVPATR